jgi:hypothetical protein
MPGPATIASRLIRCVTGSMACSVSSTASARDTSANDDDDDDDDVDNGCSGGDDDDACELERTGAGRDDTDACGVSALCVASSFTLLSAKQHVTTCTRLLGWNR